MAPVGTQPHIVVLPFPAQGHISPVLHLCKRLASHGILVTVATVDSMYKQLLQTWKPHANIRFESIPFELSIPFGYDVSCHNNRVHFNQYFTQLGPEFEAMFRKLEPAPVCIIADDFVSWSKTSAKNVGAPVISYWPGSAAWSSFHQHLELLVSNGDFPITDSSREVVDYVPGLTPLKTKQLPEYFQTVDKATLLSYCLPTMKDAAWVIVNSVYEWEPHTFDAMKESLAGPKYVSVGPLFPLNTDSNIGNNNTNINTSLRAEEDECLKWLDSQAAGSVLYISFGSCSDLSETQMEEFMQGVKLSGQQFLWVLRPEVAKDDEQFEKCKEVTRGQGMIVPWVSQLKVLGHSAVGGFITHSGWNSVFESICNGVPMVCFPRHSDQALNCKLVVEDWKVGLRLAAGDEGVLDREHVRTVIEELMHGKEIRTRVKEMEGAARAAAGKGGSSDLNLEALVREIKSI